MSGQKPKWPRLNNDWKPLLFKMFVATASYLATISMGGSLGYPCVLLQQLQSSNATIHANFETLTWIASMHGAAGIGATLMPLIMQLVGRKYTFIGSSVLLLIGWVLAMAANDILIILLSAIFHGLSSNCITIVNLVTISEMLAPKYRTASLVLLNMNQTIGMILVTTLGTLLNWKTVAMVMCVPIIIALLMAIVRPESSSWLAYKGKFEEAEKVFIWLRGTDDDEARKELKELMAAVKDLQRFNSRKTKIQETWQTMKRRDFYLPSLFMLLILTNFYISGALTLFIYSKDILETAIGDSKVAVIGYVATVCILLIGSLISLFLIRHFTNKTVLSTSLGCIASLFGCSLVTYFQSIGVIASDSIMFLYCFLGFMIFSNSGFCPMSFALAIELMPVKNRGIGGVLFNTLTCLFYFITVKYLPHVMLRINLPWTFFALGISCLICTILILIYVPETKNRTLQEIEDYYNYGTFKNIRVLEDDESKTPIVKNVE